MTCDLKLSPQCGDAEVSFTAGDFAANTCLPCGKVFQAKYPQRAASITIKVLEAQS